MQKGNSKLIKKLNIYNIIELFKTHNTLSRAQLAKFTKLTPASITKITKNMIAEGILIEEGEQINLSGRPSILLSLNKNAGYFIGIYLAPKKIISILTNYTGEIIDVSENQIFDFSKNSILSLLDAHITKYFITNKNILGIGIALNGIVNFKEGISIFSPHYKWRNFNLKNYIVENYHVPVAIENDVRLMALGEMEYGSAKNIKNFVLINIQEGIGAGIIINKEIFRGDNFCAGEIGHIKISDSDNFICSCGKSGCLETFISNDALVKRFNLAFHQNINTISSLISLYQKNNNEVVQFIDDYSKKLALGISFILNLFNPSLIILNGELNSFGNIFYKKLEKYIEEYSLEGNKNKFKLKQCKLSDLGAAQGAVSLIFQEIIK